MPYDKTVGGDDYTFQATLPGSPLPLIDFLEAADKQELIEALFKNGDVNEVKIRVAVDGWLLSSQPFYTMHKVGGAQETIEAGLRYPMPVYQWFRKRLFLAGGEGQIVTVRILLSANYDKREDY
jgi:hypothetical protein